VTGGNDVHPEELLVERELQGETLGGRDRQALDEHVRSCDVCRFVRLAAADFAREVPADAAPPPQIDRLIQTALWSVRPPEVRRPPVRWRATGGVAATVTICVAGLAAAHLAGVLNRHIRPRAGSSPALAVSTAVGQPASSGVPAPAAEAKPVEDEEPQVGPSAGSDATPPPAAPARRLSETAASRPWEELFRRATVARARGQTQQALRLYGDLARAYPRSPEGAAAFAFKARLELDQGDARGAADDFGRYLSHGGGGSLQEEALLGRAEALRLLGRPVEEQAAWRVLLNRFPGSAHAHRAKARLAELQSLP